MNADGPKSEAGSRPKPHGVKWPEHRQGSRFVASAEACTASAPAQRRRDVRQNTLDDVCAVIHAKLVRDGQEEGVCLGDALVGAKLLDQITGFSDVATAEDRAGL